MYKFYLKCECGFEYLCYDNNFFIGNKCDICLSQSVRGIMLVVQKENGNTILEKSTQIFNRLFKTKVKGEFTKTNEFELACQFPGIININSALIIIKSIIENL